jgi:hypothetical protein
MREASPRSLLFVVVIMVGSALAFTLLTAPFTTLLGGGAGAVAAAFHGVAPFVYLFVGTIALYLAWRLLTGDIRAFGSPAALGRRRDALVQRPLHAASDSVRYVHPVAVRQPGARTP